MPIVPKGKSFSNQTVSAPTHPVDLDQVPQQLERVLADILFRNSRRYPDLLRYIVERTLQGQADALKERTLGIEVFHRKPDYDSNADPVVRVTAGEVRKRLAQYYAQAEHREELRIELPSGSYVPEFRMPDPTETKDEETQQAPVVSLEGSESHHSSTPRVLTWSVALVALLGLAAIAGFRAGRRAAHALPPALNNFWSPLLQSTTPVLLCIGSAAADLPRNPNPTLQAHPLASDPITFSDAVTLTRMVGFLEAHNKSFLMQSSTTTSFADLQRTPSILIAGFDNPWTLRLTEPLRFHFVQETGSVSAIVDREHPENHVWSVNFETPYLHITQDYGVLARFHDPLTDQMVVVAAGIGEDGTAAASALSLNEQYMEPMLRGIRQDPAHPNLEVVFSTNVIDGNPGPPRVVATTQW